MEFHFLNVTPQPEVVVTVGAQPFKEAGEAVVAVAEIPGQVANLIDRRTTTGFQPTVEQVATVITPRSKVLVLNSPSNPTGAVYPAELVQALVELAVKHDMWVFTDDLYEHLVYDGEFTPAARFAQDRTLVIHGASKGYALTGWRIGYGAGPKPLIQVMSRLQGQVTSGANSLAQHATVHRDHGGHRPRLPGHPAPGVRRRCRLEHLARDDIGVLG